MPRRFVTFLILPVALLGMIGPAAGQDDNEDALETLHDKASYAIGFNIGQEFRQSDLGLDIDKVILGIREAFASREHRLSDEELLAVMTAFEEHLLARRQTVAAENMRVGQQFLEENALKEGVMQLESGLQYKVVTSGDGESPEASDLVRTHYRGTLIDGTEFDSSYERGEPAVFSVGQVIRGWTEALQRMKVGDKWVLYVPSRLAYGPDGYGSQIGPNQVLIFEIELLEIIE